MKFTDGYWRIREGVEAHFAASAIEAEHRGMNLWYTPPKGRSPAGLTPLTCPSLQCVIPAPRVMLSGCGLPISREQWTGGRVFRWKSILRSNPLYA